MSIADKLITIAENQERVYEAGKRAGEQGAKPVDLSPFSNADSLDGQITDLTNQKTALAETLQNSGVEASTEETFSTLVPKANEKIANSKDFLVQRITDTLTSYENEEITELSPYAFSYCEKLERVNLPNLQSGKFSNRTNGYQFWNAPNVREINAPKLTSAPTYFACNTSLETLNFPLLKEVSTNAFYNIKVKSVYLPSCETFMSDAFKGCSLLEEVNLPKLNSIQTNAFANCNSLVTINVAENNDLNMTINSFNVIPALENFTIGGKFKTKANVNFSVSSKLTLASAKNIINALPDYSGTADEHKYSVLFSSATIALLEADGATSPNDNSWIDYIGDKGWMC